MVDGLRELDVSWNVFKELLANHEAWPIYIFEHTSMREVWTGNKDYIFHCDVAQEDDLQELASSPYLDRSQVVVKHDDAKALLIGTQDLKEKPFGPDGGYIIHQSHRFVKETFRIKGYSHLAVAGATSFFDVPIDKQIYVAGAKFGISAKNHVDDTISMSIVDKDDVLGLFSLYGLGEGDVLEVKEFVSDFYAPETGLYDEIRPDTVSHLIPGLYMRIKYHSAGSEDVPFFVNYMWFEFNE